MKSVCLILLSAVLTFAVSCGTEDNSNRGGGGGDSDATGDLGDTTGEGDDGTNEDAAEPDAPDTCLYPEYSGSLLYNNVIPPFIWNDAFLPDGSTVDLNLYEWYCDESEGVEDSMFIIIGAGWCPNCPDYIRNVNSVASTLQANKTLLVYMEMETAGRSLSSNASAHEYINRLIGDAYGIRVGDAETLPTAGAFARSPDIEGVPTAFFIRRSDMMIVADQGSSEYYLDFAGLSANPDQTWTGAGGEVELNCGEADEESTEPNDVPEDASVITPGEFTGGICNFDPDFFKIEIEGAWKIELLFTHNVGDLDVYVWNVDANEPVVQDGAFVGSESYDDNEEFEYAGPALIIVNGFERSTTTYTLRLTEL